MAIRESDWSNTAVNQSSGAAGIAQLLGHGPVNLHDPAGQISWMLNYIKGRYGTPQKAWQYELAHGSYDTGGWLSPGWNLAYNGLGRPEAVVHDLQPGSAPTVAGMGGQMGATAQSGDLHVHLALDGREVSKAVVADFRNQVARR